MTGSVQIVGFAFVGGIGFLVDGGILTVASQVFGVNLYLSRALSFSVATLVTWLLNRSFVFAVATPLAEARGREYARYLAVQIAGALLNLGVFALLIALYPGLHSVPVVPLAVGALFGMVLNFLGARFWVFSPSGGS